MISCCRLTLNCGVLIKLVSSVVLNPELQFISHLLVVTFHSQLEKIRHSSMKVEGGGKYHVKLVPVNCHREEFVLEIISSLDHLSTITDEIFTKIRSRVTEQAAQVASLRARVTSAADKVAEHKSSTKAIQIISPAKFPEGNNPTASPRLFSIIHLKSIGEQRRVTDSEEIMSRIRDRRVLYESPIRQTDDVLQHHRVRDFNYSKGSNLGQLGTKYELGLGHPPNGVDVIDSYFLFNSSENPYQNYVVSERIGASVSKGIRKPDQLETNGKSESDMKGEENKANENQNLDDFYYYPSSVQIPDIDVPDNLPCLPGLSNTLNFDQSSDSMTIFSFQKQKPEKTFSALPPQQTSPSIPFSESEPSRIFIPPPPPLPETPAVSTKQPSVSQGPVVHLRTGVPPPPPPPPPPDHSTPRKPEPPTASSGPKMEGASGDLRGTLMAAIRDAGGKSKLKSAKELRAETRKKKNEEKEKLTADAGGGDLLADLKNSLAMRRRGISGMNDSRKQPGIGDIMQKMASSIPVDTSLDSAQGGSLSEDDDWD